MLLIHKSPVLWLGAAALLVAVNTLSSSSGGVQSGLNGVPANCSMQLPSCSNCHGGSAPFAGRTGAPTATLSAVKRALNLNEVVSVTTAVTGGVPGTTGGFLCEATAGTFTAGSNSHVLTSNSSITQLTSGSRSWTYSFMAPNTVGPVSLTSCAMTANASSGTTGDLISFAGFDNNATVATPVRLFVLPSGVTSFGAPCADGYGNLSVLGATSAPAVPNPSFAFQLVGAAPSSIGVVWAGINPPGFLSVSLDPLGLFGCTSHLANIVLSLSASTSAGSAQRAEGVATFPFALANTASLHGLVFQVQAGYIDASVAATRALPLSFSNGLRVAIP